MAEPLPEYRRRQILQRLGADGSVRVVDLAARIGVAEETIRRDLKLLDRNGELIRTHGGAVASGPHVGIDGIPVRTETPFGVRLNAMGAEKRAIARRAAALVMPGHTIALDGSTTAYELARTLPRMEFTVVTNSLIVVNLLAKRGDARVVCTGGRFDPVLQTFEGALALAAVAQLHVNWAFFSCRGIDSQRGLSDPSESSGAFKRALIDLADRTVLLADHTKFDARSNVYFAPASKLHRIITDAGLPARRLAPFRRLGVECDRAAL